MSILTHWTAPPCMVDIIESHACKLGLEKLDIDLSLDVPPPWTLIVYGSPDECILDQRSMEFLVNSSKLIGHSYHFCAGWRLLSMAISDLELWLNHGDLQPCLLTGVTPPSVNPVKALVALRLMGESEACTHAYKALEVNSQLFGGEPDISYVERLNLAISNSCLREECRQLFELSGSEKAFFLGSPSITLSAARPCSFDDIFRAISAIKILESDLERTALKNRWLRSSKSSLLGYATEIMRQQCSCIVSLVSLVSRQLVYIESRDSSQ